MTEPHDLEPLRKVGHHELAAAGASTGVARIGSGSVGVVDQKTGAALVVGFLTPLGGAGVVGVMAVAWAINHRGNGFFIFRPGEGWEYVMTLGLCGALIGTVGPGEWSLDDTVGISDDLTGWAGLALSAGAGVVGAALLLAVSWRPPADRDTA